MVLPQEPGAPSQSQRVRKWMTILDQHADLQHCITSRTHWKSTSIPERYVHKAQDPFA